MIIYDYDNNPVEIKSPDKPIIAIHVTILSGDETGNVTFDDGSMVRFDASNCRNYNYYDGSYFVTGEDIQKWLDFKPTDNITFSYERRNIFDKEELEDSLD